MTLKTFLLIIELILLFLQLTYFKDDSHKSLWCCLIILIITIVILSI